MCGKPMTDIERDLVAQGFKAHHTAAERGYVSRRSEGYLTEYNGRFGIGFKFHQPRWDTNEFHYITYYVK